MSTIRVSKISSTIERLESLEAEAIKKASLPMLAQLRRIQHLLQELRRDDELSTTEDTGVE